MSSMLIPAAWFSRLESLLKSRLHQALGVTKIILNNTVDRSTTRNILCPHCRRAACRGVCALAQQLSTHYRMPSAGPTLQVWVMPERHTACRQR